MGFLDDAVPGGNIAKPLLVALGVLSGRKNVRGTKAKDAADERRPLSKLLIADLHRPTPRVGMPDQRPTADSPQDAQPAGRGGGGILDGLGDLLDNLGKTGQKDTADSWVKPDAENRPIQPRDLGKAIGQKTLGEIARQTGMSEEELLDRLSKVLPGVVDKLTPNGQVPSNKEVAQQFPNSPW